MPTTDAWVYDRISLLIDAAEIAQDMQRYATNHDADEIRRRARALAVSVLQQLLLGLADDTVLH